MDEEKFVVWSMEHWSVWYWLKLDNWNIWDWDREWNGKSALPARFDYKMYKELIDTYTLKKLTKRTSKYDVNSLINDELIYVWPTTGWRHEYFNWHYYKTYASKIWAYSIKTSTTSVLDIEKECKKSDYWDKKDKMKSYFEKS